jgi:hypothetical protein
VVIATWRVRVVDAAGPAAFILKACIAAGVAVSVDGCWRWSTPCLARSMHLADGRHRTLGLDATSALAMRCCDLPGPSPRCQASSAMLGVLRASSHRLLGVPPLRVLQSTLRVSSQLGLQPEQLRSSPRSWIRLAASAASAASGDASSPAAPAAPAQPAANIKLPKCCSGCGITLQREDAKAPG